MMLTNTQKTNSQLRQLGRHSSSSYRLQRQVALLLQRGLAMLRVIFNSVIPRAQLFLLFSLQIYHCIQFVFDVMLRLLVMNTLLLSPTINKLRCLPATSVINLPWSVAAECIALAAPSVRSTRWSHILAQNCDFCLPHLQLTLPLEGFQPKYCHNVWHGKTRMVWLPDEKKFKDMRNRFDRILGCVGQTHRRTDSLRQQSPRYA